MSIHERTKVIPHGHLTFRLTRVVGEPEGEDEWRVSMSVSEPFASLDDAMAYVDDAIEAFNAAGLTIIEPP